MRRRPERPSCSQRDKVGVVQKAQSFRFVLVTVGDSPTALRISRALVSKKLAACVNVIRGVRSLYRWKGKIQDDRELLLIIKTNAKNVDAVERVVQKLHTYEVPEIVSVKFDRGSEPYLRWLKEAVKRKGRL